MPTRVRDKNGNFAPKTKVNVLRHHIRSRKYLLPVVAAIVAVGVYVIARSFAATTDIYSYTTCEPRYDDTCLQDSVQANVATLYYGVLGRAADKKGLDYWSKKVISGNYRYGQIAESFLKSSEGKRRYSTSDQAAFTKNLFQALYQRQPNPDELEKYLGYLKEKKLTPGQLAARLALDFEYKNTKMGDILQLLKERYKITQQLGESVVVKKFDLGGADSRYCPGRVETDTTGVGVCYISSKQSTDGIYEGVLSLPIDKLDPGAYQVVYSARYTKSNANGYIGSYGNILKSDGKTSVVTQSRLGSSYFNWPWNTRDSQLTPYQAVFMHDTTGPDYNVTLAVNAKNFDEVRISTVELRKSTDNVNKQYLFRTGAQYKNYDLLGSASSLTRGCHFTGKPGKCTITFYNSLPAGTYDVKGYLYTFLSKDIPRINTSVEVIRLDNGQLVSEKDATMSDPYYYEVTRKYSMPFDLRDNDGFFMVNYRLDTPGTVKIVVTQEVTDAYTPDYEGYHSELWYLLNRRR